MYTVSMEWKTSGNTSAPRAVAFTRKMHSPRPSLRSMATTRVGFRTPVSRSLCRRYLTVLGGRFKDAPISSVDTLGPSLSRAPMILTSLGSIRVVGVHPENLCLFIQLRLVSKQMHSYVIGNTYKESCQKCAHCMYIGNYSCGIYQIVHASS